MKKWRATASISAGKYIGEVVGETAKEAIDKAYQHKDASCSVCHECSHEVSDPEIISICVYCDETDEQGTDALDLHSEISSLKARIAELEAKLEQK